jgi:molecular chaperone GrpE
MSKKKTPETEPETTPGPDAVEETVDADGAAADESAADDKVVEMPAPTPEEELARERDDYKDRWMRAVAEQDNLRKRTRRDVVEARLFATADVMRDLLEVLDNFDRALDGDPDENGDAAFRKGVEMIRDRLRETLERRNLKRIEVAVGDEFDPRLHEAVAQVPGGDAASGSVLEVAQAGYRLDDMILRPARVIVAQ